MGDHVVTGDDLARSVARRLMAWREVAGLSQTQAGEVLECSESLIAQIEGGQRRPTLDFVARFVTKAGLSMAEVFRDAVPIPPEDVWDPRSLLRHLAEIHQAQGRILSRVYSGMDML